MMKSILICSFMTVAMCKTMKLTGMPSRMEQLADEGRLDEVLADYAVKQSIAFTNNESQPQTDIYNNFYLGSISLGTPPQVFDRIVMDTGSSDLWVADKSYTEQTANNYQKTKFDSSKSTTYTAMGGYWEIRYGSGSASGFKGRDVAKFTGTDYLFRAQIFGQAQTGQPKQPIDGICGLAYTSISSLRTPNPWNNIVSNGGTPAPPSPFFTFWLESLKGTPPATGTKKGGAITFGALDTVHCSAKCDWVTLSHEMWYEFKIDGVSAGNSGSSGPSSAISDTGTSYIVGPEDAVAKIAEELGATSDFFGQRYKFLTCNPADYPTMLNIGINGKIYAISSTNYMVNYNGDCYLAMAGSFMGDPAWILGDVFIRQFCNVYDMKKKRVGFCEAK